MSEIDALIPFVPEKYRPVVKLAIVASPFVTRAIYALMHGGGLKGVIRGIWLGTNVPKPKPPKPE